MPTFTPEDEKQKDSLNPGDVDYNRTFNDIARAEEKASFDDIANNYDSSSADSSDEDANIKKLREQESEGSRQSGGWQNNTTPKEEKGKAKAWFKKASPALGIGGVIGIGGIVMLALTTPSLLIVQMKETMVGKFNTQLSSMDARSNKLLVSKLKTATSGVCTSSVSIKCKFNSMSDKQVKKFAAAGIEIEADSKTTITGRTKPISYRFNGQTISAKDFASTVRTNGEFRNALKQAYNPKYAGFTGKAWANVATKFKISKQAPELDAKTSEEEAKKKINSISKEGVEDTGPRITVDPDDAECDEDCISQAEADKINADAEGVAKDIQDGSAGKIVRNSLSKVGASATASSFLKATGPVDSACQVYGAVTALSYAAKAIRTAQLVRYTMIFFSIADAIKAGQSPDPEDVALLGSILTTTIKDSEDATKTTLGSATDSYGYKYAAYGDSTASDQSMTTANRFMAGSGFVGDMSTATATILNLIPGGRDSARTTCKTLANPFVQGGSIVLGVAMLFVPGVNAGKVIGQAALSVSVGLVLAVLPSMLADIVAGSVTEDIVGEEAGNAITSGSGSLMSDALAAQNGNAPMSKDDAIAYNFIQTETSNQYIADELQNTSPLDATNPNSFIGSIVSSLLPLQSASNPVNFFSSLLATSVREITPTSNAISTQQYADSLDVCQDQDVLEAGYAADPFCNVIRGIPPKYLDKDPEVIVDQLISGGDLLEDGTPTGEYQAFIDKCILSTDPLGYRDVTNGYNNDEAVSCIIDDDNANYYLNYMDQRIELGMSGEDTDESAGTSTVSNTSVDEANLFTDSSSIPCATGTEDAGVSTGYTKGKPVTIRLCSLPNTKMSSGGEAKVNARASGVAFAMFEKMRTDLGISTVAISDSYRTMAEQQAAKATYGAQAATPGYSNHQMGFAFDINMGSGASYVKGTNTSYPGNKIYEWLKANANTFHFSQYPPEGWHWSINGG